MQSNVLQFKPALRHKRLSSPKATRLTTACYKASDKDHSTVDWYTPSSIVEALGGKEGFDLDPCTPEDPSRLPAPTARNLKQAQASGVLRGKFFAIQQMAQVANTNQGSANDE